MEKKRIRIKRPWSHHVIIAAYILAPLANILMVRLSLGVPVAIIVQRLFRGYGPLAASWLLTAPLVGIALYFVCRWSWYVFLAHSSLVFADFTIKLVARPLFFWHTIPAWNHVVILVGNLALVILIGTIIQRDFRSPYFQALPRSFRSGRRVPWGRPAMVNASAVVISDLSTGGCFVQPCPAAGTPGDRVSVSLTDEAIPLVIQGQVMRTTPDGAGIMFVALTHEQRLGLADLLRSGMASLRHALRHGALPQPR